MRDRFMHTGEDITVVMRRVLIADRLELEAQNEVAMMDTEYDIQGAFEQWLCRLICYALRVVAKGSDAESETGSEIGHKNGDENRVGVVLIESGAEREVLETKASQVEDNGSLAVDVISSRLVATSVSNQPDNQK